MHAMGTGSERQTQAADGAAHITICSPARVFADALAQVLELRGYAASVSRAGDLTAGRVTTVAVIDVGISEVVSLVRSLCRSGVRLVLLNVEESRAALRTWTWAAPAGCVTRGSTLHEFLDLLERVVAGETVFSASVGPLLLAPQPGAATTWRGTPLTRRELEIVGLMGRGYSNKEIARELTLECSTVKNHVHRIFVKGDIRRRSELVDHSRV